MTGDRDILRHLAGDLRAHAARPVMAKRAANLGTRTPAKQKR